MFYENLDISCSVGDRLSTILLVDNHPVKKENRELRKQYLDCVYIAAYADRIYHENEIVLLEDLSQSLELDRLDLENSKKKSMKEEFYEYIGSTEKVFESGNGLSLISDITLLSLCDGNLCRSEEDYLRQIKSISKINDDVYSFVRKIAQCIYFGNFDEAVEIFSNNFSVNSKMVEKYKLWIEAQNGVSHQIKLDEKPDSQLPQAEAEAEAEAEAPALALGRDVVTSLQKELSSQFGKLENLLGEMFSDNKASVDQVLLEKIKEEKSKVKDLRMTLAFVGTMKAGKSTTINAIVGADVLPNRSGAMTTLPTLVTHAPGVQQPILRFSNSAPFTQAIKRIQTYCNNAYPEFAQGALYEETLRAIIDRNLVELKSRYEGRNEINNFMLGINDIARICADLELESPLNEYSTITDFPEIEVEFSYLADRAETSTGKLTLIDTPGPNEAGQGHLKGVVKEQLAKASAIVCVVDPTQADSEAQAELRDWLQGAQKKSGAALFVLVNKIDTVKASERVPENFEKRALRLFPDFEDAYGVRLSVRGRVYGISSQHALLSNMVSRTIANRGGLPHWDREPWVADFLEKAYGGFWEDSDIDDSEMHQKRGDLLWKKSGMQQPMDELIASSLKQVVPLCFGAALRTIAAQAENYKNEARIRWKASERDLDALIVHLDRLRSVSDKIKEIEAEAKCEQAKVFRDIERILKDSLETVKGECLSVFNELADKKKEQNLKAEKEQKASPWTRWMLIISVQSGQQNSSAERILVEDSPITFDSKAEGRRFVSDAMEMFKSLTRKALDKSVPMMESKVNQECCQLGTSIEDKLTPLVDQLNKEIKKDFDVSIKVPSPKFPKLDLDLDIAMTKLVKKETVTRTRYTKKWYTLWLYDHEEQYSATEYRVDPEAVRKKLIENVENAIENSGKILDAYIKETFDVNVSNYLAEVETILKGMGGALDAAIIEKGQSESAQRENRERQKQLEEKFSGLIKQAGEITQFLMTKNEVAHGTL